MVLPGPRPVATFFALLGSAVAILCAQDAAIPSIEDLLNQRRFEEVLPLVEEREAEWNEAVRLDDSLEYRMGWAKALLVLGMVEDRLNRFEPALRHLRLARDLSVEAEAGPHTLGDTLDALGKAAHRAGHYPEAEASLRSAIEERAKLSAAEREPWLSASKDHLALLYLTMGRYRESGRLLHETLATATDDRKVLAQRHSYLGKYFLTMESYATACEHYERALEIAREEWDENHPLVISLTGDLGLASLRLAPSATADDRSRELMRARDMLGAAAKRTAEQPESHEVNLALATYLNNSGLLSLSEGNLEEARQIFTEALYVLTPRVGDDSPVLCPFFSNIGRASQLLGDFAQAGQAFHQAALRYRASVGSDHQRTIEASYHLALNLLLSRGSEEEIAREVERQTETALALFDRVVEIGTERQRLNYLQGIDLVSLPCSHSASPTLIANTLLRSKGLILDTLLIDQEESGELLDILRAKQRQLDDLLFRFESRDNLRELRDEITALETRRRSTESGETRGAEPVPDWTVIQAALPERSAFVDYVRFRDFRAGPDGPPSYAAVLHLPSGEPQWVPLGTERELQTWLGVMQERLDYRAFLMSSRQSVAPPALRLHTALRNLHDSFWAPVAELLPAGTDTIAISPDGSLNLVSFAVLLDRENRFLANAYRQFVYTSSGRDLLVQEERPALSEGPWAVIAVPDFEPKSSPEDLSSPNALDRVVLDTIDDFPSVPGAREELQRLRRIIPPKARGPELINASEPDLRKLAESPVVLHLTTHAFFLAPAPDSNPSGIQDFDQQPDRLYRSGLLLTEAKRALSARLSGAQVPVERDGVLFPEEVATLPLENTRLVTLSSCESGLGETVSGEGVHGLRRGFTLAGASNILLSLWPVSDNSTPKFMERLYRLALATDQIGQSLWETQRRTLQKVDPSDDADLEEAVLRYGCFVLCQRGPLQAAVPMPELKTPLNLWWIVTAVGVTGLFSVLLIRLFRKREPRWDE